MVRSRAIRGALLTATIALLLGPAALGADYDDSIQVYADNEKGYREILNIEITKDTIDGLTWQNKGRRTESKPAGEVRSVSYGDAPDEWTEGLTAMTTRQYETAIEAFKGAVNAHEAKKCGPWVVEYAAFQTALCKAAMARMDQKAHLDDAQLHLKSFLADYPESRLRPDALLEYGDILLLAQKPGEARRQYTDCESVAKGRKLFVRYEFMALLGKARSYAREGDWVRAITDFESLAQRAKNEVKFVKGQEAKVLLEEIRLLAAGARGDAMLAKAESTGNSAHFAQARSYFENLTGEFGSSDRVRAMSGVGLAVCLLHAKKAREAMIKLSEVKVAYFSQRNEVAKALYYMAKAADILGHAKQAVIYLKELKELYPDTEWARRAD